LLFINTSSEEIARQITLIEFEYFSAIKPQEFFRNAWTKPDMWHLCPGIRQLINRFNATTRWIMSKILTPEKPKETIKMIKKFIHIAKCLRSINNYHTLMAILSSLNEGPIYRLKQIRDRVPLKYQKILKELESLMSATGSYKVYRSQVVNHPLNSPCLPYLGIHLRDLVYFEEGGSGSGSGNRVSTKNLINFKQRKNVYSVIYLIQLFQQTPFSFQKVDSIHSFLKELSGQLDDNELMRLSLLREPRNQRLQTLRNSVNPQEKN